MYQAQFDFEAAEKARDYGIQKAVDHANAVNDNWSERAYDLLKEFINSNKVFKCEDFRMWCCDKIEQPPSLRAFGGIIMKAAKAGLIEKVGIEAVSNVKAHMANAGVWRGMV